MPANQLSKKRNLAGTLLSNTGQKILRNPSIAGGTAACTVSVALICANALWYQPQQHPSPLFSTRDGMTTKSIAPASKRVTNTIAPEIREMVSEIQTALQDKGYYEGRVDGILGSRTRAAIEEFQEQADLEINGRPSAKLLTYILVSPQSLSRVKPTNVVAVETATPTPKAVETADDEKRDMIAKIQSGLRNYGDETIVVDGIFGEQTASAIRRFQLDFGMEITGEPSKSLLLKLKEIGAIG
ncbi:MAG: peptidoglycan-binding protein [Pseudomonadota bacterium]